MENSEGKEERDREIFLMFTRLRTSKSIINTNRFKLTVVAPPCYPGKNILNWGGNEEKIKHASQRVHEIFFLNLYIIMIITLIWAKSVQLSESKKKINLEERIFLKRRKQNQSDPNLIIPGNFSWISKEPSKPLGIEYFVVCRFSVLTYMP